MRILTLFLVGLAVCSLAFFSGCGGADDGRVSISGTVTLDEKPVEGAMIAFIGGGGGALATASTDKDGKFQTRVALGTNQVTVSKEDASAAAQAAPKSEEDTLMGTDAQYKEQLKSKPKSLVPAKYSNPDTSGLQFEIVAGMQPMKIPLSSK
jgi:hypothetical protein